MLPTVYKKTLKCVGNNSWMSSSGVTFNLTCGKGVTELQNLASLRLSSFAESYQMQQKNFDVSPYLVKYPRSTLEDPFLELVLHGGEVVLDVGALSHLQGRRAVGDDDGQQVTVKVIGDNMGRGDVQQLQVRAQATRSNRSSSKPY